MSKHIVLGTAGHIDHGKTSLIHALSGMHTDRLPEEIKRGITIELGFAQIELSEDLRVSIVDVPGHEKFVHHMVAGVSGMDLIVLVIAADEGIMPQTREHLAICRLLGVQHGLVALTKIDLVDDEWLQLVQEDIQEQLMGTFLQNAPVAPVSSQTGFGLDNLRQTLAALAQIVKPRNTKGIFRLPVDRIFTIKGFGTVVTGTVISGSLLNGETVDIIPGKQTSKIRGFQVHGQKVDQIVAGQRAAINLQNIDKGLIHRGLVLVRPQTIPKTLKIDAECMLLKSTAKPLKNRSLVRFHSGTAEIICRIVLMDRDVLNPGETAFVQFRLTEQAAALPDDRFVIRSYSPVITIGGGRILDVEPFKHKRMASSTITHFKQLASPDPLEKLHGILEMAGAFGIKEAVLQYRFPDPNLDKDDLIRTAISKSLAIRIAGSPSYLIAPSNWKDFKQTLIRTVSDFHKKNPLRPGISREELRTTLKLQPPEIIFNAALDSLVIDNLMIDDGKVLKISNFELTLNPTQEAIVSDIMALVGKAGFDGISQKEIMEKLDLNPKDMKLLFQHVIDKRVVQRLPGGLYMGTASVDEIKIVLKDLFSSQETLTVGEFRDTLNISRKQAVPLLEYFDSIGLTLRKGDVRILRRPID